MKEKEDASIVKKNIHKNFSLGPYLYPILLLVSTIVIIIFINYLLQHFVLREDRKIRKELADKATDVSIMLNPDQIRKLTFTPSDINLPEYIRLHNQLVCISKFKEFGFDKIYTVKMKSGGFYFGPEGYEYDDPESSPPGTKYERPPAELINVFINKQIVVAGPYTDEYGSFVSAFVPVIDPLTQKVIMAVGIDIDANLWKDRLSDTKKVPLIICWLLLFIVYSGTFLLWYRQKMPVAKKWNIKYIEAYITISIGLILTFLFAYNSYITETDAMRSEFYGLARMIASNIKENFVKVNERISAINYFFSSSEYVVSQSEFETFCRAIITRDNIISSVGFVSAVPYSDMQHHIEERQYRGIKEYSIFQTVEGKKIAIKKDVYYPIEYLVSNTHSVGELSIGFDMGSLPEAYSAINEAMSAGLPSSTIPFVSPTFPRYISVFIFNKVSSSMQQGFVLSEIKLNFAVSPGAEIKILNNNIGVNFYYLDLTRDDVTKKHLFSIDYRQKEKTKKNERFSISLPLFFAGQTYALSISGENLLGQGNIKGWLIISVAGFLLTLTLTFIICYFTTRQIVLEKEVSLRTLELRHQIQFEKFVADVSSILWRITRIDSQFNITSILKMVGEFADVDRSYIYLLSEDGITLSLVYEWCRDGIEAQEMFFQQIPLNMFSTLRTYLLNNRIIEIQDIDSLVVGRDITEIEKDKLKREGVVSVLAIPMVWEGKVIGCMGFDVVNRKKEWGDTCHTLLKIIAGQITGIIMKLKAEEKIWYFSSHDVLTGLYNRAYLEEEMKRLDTPRQLPISIIMGDLNNLKQINDIYGHSAGDEVLQKVSEVLRISCRKEDIIARWGGDEFVILLSQTDVKTVMTICNRIIENCKDVYVKGQRVSIAIGCSTKEDIEKDLAVVLKEAEEKMYKHKSIVKGNREA